MIPDYQTLMLPVLKASENGSIHTKQAIKKIADDLSLTQEERELMLPSGKQRRFNNRINWAKSYLKQAGLVKYPQRGFFEITERGKEVLSKKPTRIDNNYLDQ